MTVTKLAYTVCPFCGCTDTYCIHGTTRECYDCGSTFFEGEQGVEHVDSLSTTVSYIVTHAVQ